jgi:diguanylate cyclase (GGDEF)-like protein
VADQDYQISEDLEKPEEVLALSGERSYTIDQLLRAIPQIDVIREYNVIHNDDFIELKEIKRYSLDFHKRRRNLLYDPADFSRLFGSRAREVFSLLQENGYAESQKGKIRLKTKTVIAHFDDFSLERNRELEEVVFRGLEKLLKNDVEVKKDSSGEWTSREAYLLYDKRAQQVPRVSRSSRDYIFRIGNRFLYVDFFYIPSQELLELIQLRLTLVFQDLMENFFQIISSFSLDRDVWQKGLDRHNKFRGVLENLFRDAWTLFDLDHFSLQIHTEENAYAFVGGAYHCHLNKLGTPTWTYHDKTVELPPVLDLSREFLVRNLQLVYSQFTGEPVTMDIYLKSRSVNNIDPRTSVLLHSFIKLLKEALSRLIETVIPILQLEETNRTLKRHFFIESLRLRNRSYEENINLIINNSLSVMKWFFSFHQINIYTDNSEFIKMLRIFQDQNKEGKELYTLLKSPMTHEEKRAGNFIEMKILEQIGEDLSFYFKVPMERDGDVYLEGTALERIVRSALHQFHLPWPSKGLKSLADWSFSPNSGRVTNDLVDWLSHDMEWLGSVVPASLAARLMKSFSLFFDLASSLDLNLESGITSMRGSRDRLTGLYNRQTFSKRLTDLFNRSVPLGLIFIDMDNFKIYNDAVSHGFGDKILIQLASSMLKESYSLNQTSLAGRFGGDEFCFSIEEKKEDVFQELACRLFRTITDTDMVTHFSLEDKPLGTGFDINLISFLHRLLRPDVGGVRGSGSDYTEEKGLNPRNRLTKLYNYYQKEIEGAESEGEIADSQQIVEYFFQTISQKVIRNKIFKTVDDELAMIIRMFLSLQMDNMTTDKIRAEIIKALGGCEIVRILHIGVSCGAAHSGEDRLRSVSSLFNAGDGRAYMAKHNGRNGLYGLSNQRLI